MKSKKLYAVTIILIALGFAVTGIMICFMPEIVPIHYNARGEVNELGSRYTYLIFPAFSALSALILIPLSRKRANTSEETVLLYTGISMVLLFDLLGVLFAYIATDVKHGTFGDLNLIVYKITFIILGVLLVVLGNLMPKFRKNTVIGLRTSWSLYSDDVWQKSNRLAGISAVICGFIMIVCSALLSGMAVLIVGLTLLIIWAISGTVASYIYYKKDLK